MTVDYFAHLIIAAFIVGCLVYISLAALETEPKAMGKPHKCFTVSNSPVFRSSNWFGHNFEGIRRIQLRTKLGNKVMRHGGYFGTGWQNSRRREWDKNCV